jgi:hypothetical protein
VYIGGMTLEELVCFLEYKEGKLFWIKSPSKRIQPRTRAGTLCPTGYRQVKIQGKKYLEHRLIWYLIKGVWPALEIDHINRKRDDNRIENLREVNHKQNCKNRKYKRKGRGKGYVFDRTRNKYMAYIKIDGRLKYLGRYQTAEEASTAHEKAKLTYSTNSCLR